MTARYRCPWCGLGYTNREKIILHFSDYHVEKLFKMVRKGGYRVIETFGTPDRPSPTNSGGR